MDEGDCGRTDDKEPIGGGGGAHHFAGQKRQMLKSTWD